MIIKIGNQEVEVNKEDLTAAIENETAFELPAEGLTIRTTEQENDFVKNLKKDSITTAFEMEVKKWRDELGLEFKGKNFDNLFEALTDKHKAEFTKDPKKQLEAYQKDIDTLKARNQELEGNLTKTNESFSQFKNETVLTNEFAKHLPNNIALPKEDMMLILRNRVKAQINENGGIEVLGQDGSVMKDVNLNPVGLDKVMQDFFVENDAYLKPISGGRGGNDATGGDTEKSIEAFTKRLQQEGIEPNSEAFNKRLNAAIESKEVEL